MICKKIKNIWEFLKLFQNISKVVFEYKRRIWIIKNLIYRFIDIAIWKRKHIKELIWLDIEIGIFQIFREKAQSNYKFWL